MDELAFALGMPCPQSLLFMFGQTVIDKQSKKSFIAARSKSPSIKSTND